DQWAATFDAITDAVCIVDEHGEINRCNESADALLGALNNGRGHRKFGEVFPPPGDSATHTIEHVLLSGEPRKYDVRLKDHWYSIRLDPIPPSEQVEPSVVAVISDVTERRTAEEERGRLLENAERARKEAEISRLEAEAARAEAEK